MNTRILEADFEYLVPKTIQESIEMLDRYGPQAKPLAGGTDLLVQMKKEVLSPRYLIDLAKIPEMCFIRMDDGWLKIGGATKWSEILTFCAGDRKYGALSDAVSSLAKVQVRNMGTIGGNLCTASPAADSAPPLLVFDSRVKLKGPKGERLVELEDFFVGVNQTVVSPNEIMIEVQIPPVKDKTGSAFIKTTRVGADISKISCAVFMEREGELCRMCRIAMGSVAPVPLKITAAADIVEGKKIGPSVVEEVAHHAAGEIKPIDDIRSTAAYRREMSTVLVRDVFWKAWHRAGGGAS
jgi:CO/xanthine dehydrogenase FAD-binding subunit